MPWRNATYPVNDEETPMSAVCETCGQPGGLHLPSAAGNYNDCPEPAK